MQAEILSETTSNHAVAQSKTVFSLLVYSTQSVYTLCVERCLPVSKQTWRKVAPANLISLSVPFFTDFNAQWTTKL